MVPHLQRQKISAVILPFPCNLRAFRVSVVRSCSCSAQVSRREAQHSSLLSAGCVFLQPW